MLQVKLLFSGAMRCVVMAIFLFILACSEQEHSQSNETSIPTNKISISKLQNQREVQPEPYKTLTPTKEISDISANIPNDPNDQEKIPTDAVDIEKLTLLDNDWGIKQTSDEQDDFLLTLDVNTNIAKWMNLKIADSNETIQGKIAILQRVEIENNFAAKSVALTALNSKEVDVASLALDMIYSWGDDSLAPNLVEIASNHPDIEIRQQAQELYEYFSEAF